MDYQSVFKDPLKFYEQVFNQDITKHKVINDSKKASVDGSPLKKSKTVTSKVTKRPYLKMMEKIKLKIIDSLKEKIGSEFGTNILLAL